MTTWKRKQTKMQNDSNVKSYLCLYNASFLIFFFRCCSNRMMISLSDYVWCLRLQQATSNIPVPVLVLVLDFLFQAQFSVLTHAIYTDSVITARTLYLDSRDSISSVALCCVVLWYIKPFSSNNRCFACFRFFFVVMNVKKTQVHKQK